MIKFLVIILSSDSKLQLDLSPHCLSFSHNTSFITNTFHLHVSSPYTSRTPYSPIYLVLWGKLLVSLISKKLLPSRWAGNSPLKVLLRDTNLQIELSLSGWTLDTASLQDMVVSGLTSSEMSSNHHFEFPHKGIPQAFKSSDYQIHLSAWAWWSIRSLERQVFAPLQNHNSRVHTVLSLVLYFWATL